MAQHSGEYAPLDNRRLIAVYSEDGSPFAFGLADGMAQPFDLTSGLTWDDDDEANQLYDHGVNVGQNLTRLLMGAL